MIGNLGAYFSQTNVNSSNCLQTVFKFNQGRYFFFLHERVGPKGAPFSWEGFLNGTVFEDKNDQLLDPCFLFDKTIISDNQLPFLLGL